MDCYRELQKIEFSLRSVDDQFIPIMDAFIAGDAAEITRLANDDFDMPSGDTRKKLLSGKSAYGRSVPNSNCQRQPDAHIQFERAVGIHMTIDQWR